MKKTEKRKIVPWVLIGILLTVAVVIMFFAASDEAPGKSITTEDTSARVTSSQATNAEQTSAAGHGNGNDEEGSSSPETTRAEAPTSPLPQNTDTGDIAINEFGCFSGEYVEDGSNVPVENVAAMRITNRSDRFLEYAKISVTISGKEAVFVVSGLPPWKSVWVLEANKTEISDTESFEYKDAVTTYRDDVISETDKVKLIADGDSLIAENTTGDALRNVTVYYKNLHSDGRFFGGITYRISVGDIAAGESVRKIAGHYDKDNSQIVRIDFQ